MAKSILEVRGIGPSTAALLAEHGIASADDLATRKLSQVVAIKGFNEIRAAQVIADAKALFHAARPAPDENPPKATGKTQKEQKQGKDKKKKEEQEGEIEEKQKGGEEEKKEKIKANRLSLSAVPLPLLGF